jgi:hypothetical protein
VSTRSAFRVPRLGEHGDARTLPQQVDTGLSWLLDRVAPPTAAQPGYIHEEGNDVERMHATGSPRSRSRKPTGCLLRTEREIATALVAAVACIERGQSTEGGWYYYPVSTSSHEGSVTICVVQALRAAKDAGILVDSARIRARVDYVKRACSKRTALSRTRSALPTRLPSR